MLVLQRKPGESIVINDNIVITLVEIRGDKARIGIDAPKEVSIHRREVWEAIQRKQETASIATGPVAESSAAPATSTTTDPGT